MPSRLTGTFIAVRVIRASGFVALLFIASSCSAKHNAPTVVNAGSAAKGTAAGSGGRSTGGSSGAGASGSVAADSTTCETASDCAYGEIDHEIVRKTDCICLFGCPSLAQNERVIARRSASYAALCDPTRDGSGNPCPIDDCVVLPAPLCVDGVCKAAP
jgi:hypothetical protein